MLSTFSPSLLLLTAPLLAMVHSAPLQAREQKIKSLQGHLRIIQYDVTNQVVFNETVGVPQDEYLTLDPVPNVGWTINVPDNFSNTLYLTNVYIDPESCLTAHKLTGNSSLALDACPGTTEKPLTPTELQHLRERQLFRVEQFGQQDSKLYELIMNGNYSQGVPSRPDVKIIADNQHIHLEGFDVDHSQLGKRLFFQAFD